MEIIQDRLTQVMKVELLPGSHDVNSKDFCVMEAVAYVAGEPWTDSPTCACPVIGTFLRSWNDALPDADRTRLLRDLIPKLVGTRSTPKVELRRSLMAADWLVRTYTPAWLRLAKLTTQADSLEALPEITSMAQVRSLYGLLEKIRQNAAAAKDAARAAAGAAAWAEAGDTAWAAAAAAAGDAARAAAGDAAENAAWNAAWPAAWDEAWDTAGAEAWNAAWDTAWAEAWAAAAAAAWVAAGAAALDALKPTKESLQASVLVLVQRMIEVTA